VRARLFAFLTLAALACAPAPRAAGQGAAGRAQAGSAQAAAWSRYTFPGEEFSAELPGMPSVFHTFRGGGGSRSPADLKVRVFSLYHDYVVYFVVAYDEPRSSESLDFFAAHLRGAWGLEPKGEVKLGEFGGRAYGVTGVRRGRLAYDLRGEGRVFRAKRHAYLALALADEEGRPEVARFLDAFTLGAKPAGQTIADEEPVPPFVPPKTATPPADVASGPGRGGGQREPPGDDDRKAMIVYKPEPAYTEEARRKGVSGGVRLRAVLTADGTVADIEPVKWLSNGLTERAIRAARAMRFFPARKDGRPVSQRITLEYFFNVY
jgi:TonB family protein